MVMSASHHAAREVAMDLIWGFPQPTGETKLLLLLSDLVQYILRWAKSPDIWYIRYHEAHKSEIQQSYTW